ncbi:PREDICTED: G-type lectin S-receptor-like serine/threonine-protein kinase At2g19130, partial [Populus euphratica]|uniref:G-type lectin S-receptor-like serine/threonine-protein kinase At2g19130 n=1 Tax=Populus euphratica TaxID=75702 RepID=A0AAJ6V0N9_POPEU
MIVWVANRESPSNDPASSKLELSADGNLVLLTNFTKTIWSTALASSMSNTSTAEAVLLDDGNFVVRDGSNPATIYWQSFDYPTDTWLPGGKLGINKHTGQVQRLISWKNSEDPAPGMFSIGIDPNGSSQFFIEWNRSHRYWSSGDWDGERFTMVPEMRLNYIFNFSYVSNENESYFTYSVYNSSILSRTVIGVSGQIRQLTWLEGVWNWFLFWSQPRDQAGVYGLCGAFGVFNENSSSYDCECLKGVADGRAGSEIYIRVAASELELQIGNGNPGTGNIKRTIRTTLAVAIPTTLITFGLFMYFRCLRKGKLIHRGKEYTGHDLLIFDFDTDPSSTNKESSSVDNRKNRWSKNMELPLFSYES